VRICAPFEVRKRRMMERVGSTDEAKIADEIQQNDQAHTEIMRRNFQVSWADAENYDLVLNTERVSVQECVDRVLGLVKSPEFAETDESRHQLQDLALTWRVKAALRLSPQTRGLRLMVTVRQGCVTLAGLLDKFEQCVMVNEVVAQAEGVKGIDDRMRAADVLRPRFQ
jgi:osmotically-inducible protein OsmY